MTQRLVWMFLGWLVVNTSGQVLAGPFVKRADCEAIRQEMARRYAGIAPTCLYSTKGTE